MAKMLKLQLEEVSEDEKKLAEDEIQKITDKFIEEVDSVTKHKEDELMEI